ncbi:hypothetical protein [Ramlibacter humi]|uniref:DUF4149 domain-containing protein n=1 Tax=Ramlibacter humi TaxID=2530451 RepID=A0A4Z0CC55_9BURK|nr:hypothetical protein [Ramlibacter humi]TFZ07659.1 hypothetical protein EZ216_00385 [Ramlibacter humi]
MSSAIYGAFFFTVALLVTTAYFIMGGLPLLVLKHDVPLDARFIRGFFNVYYVAAFWAGLGASASYGLWGRPVFAAGTAAIAAAAFLLRRHLLPAMHRLGLRIEANDEGAIRRFRRMHVAALLINLALLVLLVWGVIQLSQALAAK